MSERQPLSAKPFLQALVEVQGSDLHCKVGSPPRIRLGGRLRKLQAPSLSPADTEHMVREVLRQDLAEQFDRHTEVDFAYSTSSLGRFRVHAFRQRGSVGLVFRRITPGALSVEELNLPSVVSALAMEPRGLVLVTGPTGAGKTTTMAAMVDAVNSAREVHIVTVEDPIEVLHADKLGMINQREVGVDTGDFAAAIRSSLRQDPDVILVGEMRDTETVRAALMAAETGHLVLSTVHTSDAPETVNRIIDFFPPHEQRQVRLTLAGNLRGIVSQRLVARADGDGRIAVVEICVGTGRVAEAIMDPEKTSSMGTLIAEGAYYGMQSFDQHLAELVRQRVITVEVALAAATVPQDLSISLRQLGVAG